MAPKGKSTTKKDKEVACPEASQPATQPEESLSFERLQTCLDPADAIHALFEYQAGIARHNESCTHGTEESTSALTRDLEHLHIHEETPDDHRHEEETECAHTKCESSFYLVDDGKGCQYGGAPRSHDRDENSGLIEHIYRRLLVGPRQPFLTKAWVCTWSKELKQCDISDVLEALGPVRGEWFGRALKAMEGEESKIMGTYAWPTCGACGCYKDKPRCVDLHGPCKVHEKEHGETKGRERQGRVWGGNGDLVMVPVDEEVAAWLKMRN